MSSAKTSTKTIGGSSSDRSHRDATHHQQHRQASLLSACNYNKDTNDDVRAKKIRERFERDFLPRFGSLWRQIIKENEKKTYYLQNKTMSWTIAPTMNFVDAIERNETVQLNFGKDHNHDNGCNCVQPVEDYNVQERNEINNALDRRTDSIFDDEAEELEYDGEEENSDDENVFEFAEMRNQLPKVQDDSINVSDDEEFAMGDGQESITGYEDYSSSNCDNGKKNEIRENLEASDHVTKDRNNVEYGKRTNPVVIDLLSSDSEESFVQREIKRIDENIPSKKKDSKDHRPKKRKTNDFTRNRDVLTNRFFEEFNEKVFDGRLGSVSIEWSKKMNTTAGITRLRKTHYNVTPGKSLDHIASIELSTKVVDNVDRLRSTLLHELIHAAVWILE
jgi:hypothetical protein